jgi:hypothetical protein
MCGYKVARSWLADVTLWVAFWWWCQQVFAFWAYLGQLVSKQS